MKGGEYICRNFLHVIQPILPYTDFIVGNSMDIQSLAEELKWTEKRLDEIALSLGSKGFFLREWTVNHEPQDRLSKVGQIEGDYKTVIITQVR